MVRARLGPERGSSERRGSDGDARVDSLLALADHSLYAGHRAIGRKLVIQCVWIYEHAVDLDGLRQFHRNLGFGLLGRRIERSPLPFARPDGSWIAGRRTSISPRVRVHALNSATGQTNAHNCLSIRNGDPAGILAFFP
ncbi:hypothetical protein I552_3859 [Mycobacterium xenopi 3993]|nr:hypothetical protein I552_3859 [Mycobacterium xenopi 3993]